MWVLMVISLFWVWGCVKVRYLLLMCWWVMLLECSVSRFLVLLFI